MSPAIDAKAFATLRAEAALQGYRLTRSDAADGPVAYRLERHGLVRELTAVELAEMFKQKEVLHG